MTPRGWRPRHILTRPPAALVGAVYGGALLALADGPWWQVALGAAALPPLEYVVHRWGFHGARRWWPAGYDRIHGAHHRLPNDPGRRIVPLSHSLPVAALAWLVLPGPALAGLLGAYLVYELAHGASHRRGWLPWPLAAIRRHHLRHHALDENAAFGVTSPLLDLVFRTMPVQRHSLRDHRTRDERAPVIE